MQRILLRLTAMVFFASGQLAFGQADIDEREAAEQLRQESFRRGAATLVDNFNADSTIFLSRAIDRDDFLERTFGLRLIDGGIKRDFRDDMRETKKWRDFIEAQFSEESEKGMRATLLLVESRGDRGRAVVRFDMSFFRANYHDYELILDDDGRMRIIDWKDYFWGHEFTERLGLTMIQAQPNMHAARKLVDFPNVRENQIFQIMELLKATRDRDFDRYQTIVDNLDAKMETQRIVIKLGLDTARAARKRRAQRAALELVAEHYPNDPFFALALMDFYLPEKRYQEAFDTLAALQRHLRIDDPLLNARMSSVLLAMERVDDAHELAVKSVAQDPGLELGWWSVFRARVTAENYGTAIEALEKLENEFGHSLGPDALAKDPMFRPLMLSDEYRVWFEESD